MLALGVGRSELTTLGAELVAPGMRLAALVVPAARLGGQDLDLLLHGRDAGTLLAGARLRVAHGVLERRQRFRLLLRTRNEHLGLLLSGVDLLGNLCQFGLRIAAALHPQRMLGLQVGQLLFDRV